MREKFRNFVAWAEPDPKAAFSPRFMVPFDYPGHSIYRKQFYSKPVVSMKAETRYFSSLIEKNSIFGISEFSIRVPICKISIFLMVT